MKKFNLNNKEYKVILIEEKERNTFDNIESRIMFYHKDYKSLGLIKDILKNEDICESIVSEKLKGYGFRNYKYSDYNNEISSFNVYILYSCITASDSFITYLQTTDLDFLKEYLLIEKI